jgi:hypothetical protein
LFIAPHAGSYTVYLNVIDNAGIQKVSNNATISVISHDVAIKCVNCSQTVVGRGLYDIMNVTVANLGGYTETFKVTAYANVASNATSILSQNIILYSNESECLDLQWNTAGFMYGSYTITVNVTLEAGETNTWIGPYIYGTVKVTIPGDILGIGVVGLKDLGLITGHWKQTVPPAPANADPMNVRIIGLKDLGVVTGHWKEHI